MLSFTSIIDSPHLPTPPPPQPPSPHSGESPRKRIPYLRLPSYVTPAFNKSLPRRAPTSLHHLIKLAPPHPPPSSPAAARVSKSPKSSASSANRPRAKLPPIPLKIRRQLRLSPPAAPAKSTSGGPAQNRIILQPIQQLLLPPTLPHPPPTSRSSSHTPTAPSAAPSELCPYP